MTNAELIARVRGIAEHGADWRINVVLNDAADALEAAEKRIEELERILKKVQENSGINFRLWQEAEAQLPKEGEWIEVHDWIQIPQEERGTYRCSACGQVMKYPWNYCPNCGARMQTVTDCHTLEESER